MKVIAVDDEYIALKNIESKLKTCEGVREYHLFSAPFEALDFIKENQTDVALLDIDMNQMDGLSLAKRIKEIWPECGIVFTTGYSEYAVQAFALKASGYLLKPFDEEDLRKELEYIRSRKKLPTTPELLRVQCFGNFEVFYDDVPVKFFRAKSKELFAFLVDRRGASVSMAEIAARLWEDGRYSEGRNRQILTFIQSLKETLKQIGFEDIIQKERNSVSVDVRKLDCDYYRYIEEPTAINDYFGEYMSQYWWSEFSFLNHAEIN